MNALAGVPGAPPQSCTGCHNPLASQEGFRCEANRLHALCEECFASYISMCAADREHLPLRCFEPRCGCPIELDAATRVLGQGRRSLMACLERALVLAAAQDMQVARKDDVVSCAHCPYFELRRAGSVQATRRCHVPQIIRTPPPPPPGPQQGELGDGGKVGGGGDDDDDDDGYDYDETVFECRACGRSRCLICEAPLSAGSEGHSCGLTPERVLYSAILDSLADASTRRCPSCGLAWVKDLACTHMRCPCSTRWCYHCGEKPPNDQFYGHSCPLYLKHRFGDRTGCPALALRRFHVMLQMEALERLRGQVGDDALWNATVARYFPGGVLDSGDVAHVRSVLEAEAREREAAREREEMLRLRREEANRRAAELAAQAEARRQAVLDEMRRGQAELEAEAAARAAQIRTRRLIRREELRAFIIARREALQH